MNSRPFKTAALAVALALFLANGGAVFADTAQNSQNSQQNLSISIFDGSIVTAGSQNYYVSGGNVAFASIDGQTLNPSTTTLQFQYNAQVYASWWDSNGTFTHGFAQYKLQGTTIGGSQVSVSGYTRISSMIPAVNIPLGCTTTCNSAIPFLFLGGGQVNVGIGSSPTPQPENMTFESPYISPFGAPIILASTDGSILIVTTYSQGNIQWNGVKLGGTINGKLGTSTVTGRFNLTSTESENLVAGTAQDSGTMMFSGMSPSSLNARGTYNGSSVIPAAGAIDCSIITGFPGTCSETGFNSNGVFSLRGSQSSINGKYTTTWSIPAYGFNSLATATVTANQYH
jgi:hypothetical protein